MEFKDLLEKYYEEDNIIAIADSVIEAFKKPISSDVEEEYDVGEVIVEFIGQNESEKRYDLIEELGNVLKHKQPKLYSEEGDYLNDALVKYYCFKNDKNKLKTQIEDFLSRDYDYDLFLGSIRQIQYNGHVDLYDFIIEQEYEKIRNSPKLIGGAEYELAVGKFHIELERLFLLNQDKKENVDFVDFTEKLSKYNFKSDTTKTLEIGLFDDSLKSIEELLKSYPKNQKSMYLILEARFLKMMYSKNCSFIVCGSLCQKLFHYFEKKKGKNWADILSFESESFREFIANQSNFLFRNGIEKAFTIWGSSYFLDFLFKNQIIDETQYESNKSLVEDFKEKFKKSYKYELWQYAFIHKWKPAEGISQEEWEAERQEFESTYELKSDFSEIQEDFFQIKGMDLEDMFPIFSPLEPKKPKEKKLPLGKYVPIRTEPKISRNEKVNVKYKDGRIVNDVKYKKVMNDVNNGECEII